MGTRYRRVAGVDDAGRGSMLGPLVIAGVCLVDDKLESLTEMGVRDSKLLSPNRREVLYQKIVDISDRVSLIKLAPEIIDDYVSKGKKYKKLNYLEAVSMARVIEPLGAEIVYVDASDVDVERFKQDILGALERRVEIVSAHHADRIYPLVSAASIVAKVNRDRELSKLADKYGSIGSGYPADARTIEFLKQWIKEHRELPPFARKSWKTVRRLE
ncbi:MAG: ribonuclease HII [Nitrososphaerales archaeon]